MNKTNDWPMVELGELVKKTSETKGDSDIPVFSVTKHSGFVSDYFKKNVHSKDQSKYKVVNEGEFAYATIHLDEGSIGIAPEKAAVSPMYTTFRIASPDVDPQFLLRFLKSNVALSQYAILGTGSIERRKNINFEAFSRLTVPLPPLAEQQRIAEILDQSQSLINDSLILEEKSETLLKASFIAAFGHPLDPANPINRQRVGAVSKVITGNTPPRKDPSNYGSTVEWLKSDNLGGLQPTPAAELLSDVGARKARLVEPGATLITCIAGSRESIGKSSLLDRTAAFNQQINAIVPGEELDPLFLFAQVKTAPELIRREATDGMKGIVSKKTLESVKILVPSVHAQRQFSEAATKFMSLKDYTQRRTSELRTLHESLSTRAFAGQL